MYTLFLREEYRGNCLVSVGRLKNLVQRITREMAKRRLTWAAAKLSDDKNSN